MIRSEGRGSGIAEAWTWPNIVQDRAEQRANREHQLNALERAVQRVLLAYKRRGGKRHCRVMARAKLDIKGSGGKNCGESS